jgi:hypothetical protein
MQTTKSQMRMSLAVPAPMTPSPSLPPSPGPSTLLPAIHIDTHAPAPHGRVLLLPTVRRPRAPPTPPTPAPPRPARHLRKSVSTPAAFEPEPAPRADGAHWLAPPRRFEIVREQLVLRGFQLYAVEKWCVRCGGCCCRGVLRGRTGSRSAGRS